MSKNARDVYLAALAVAVTVCAVAVAGVVYLYQEATHDHERELLSLSKSLEQSVFERLELVDIALQVSADEVARQIEAGHPNGESITRFLARQRGRVPHLDLLRATNARGEAIYGEGVVPADRASLA